MPGGAPIFSVGELVEEAVIFILETTAADGKNYKTRSLASCPVVSYN
jgi:hypothetical protein